MSKIFLIICLILLNIQQRLTFSDTNCKKFGKKFKFIEVDSKQKIFNVQVYNIRSLDEIHFECLDYCKSNVTIPLITFYLSQKLVFNNLLNLRLHSNFYSRKNIFFRFSNVKAIDLSLDIFALANNYTQIELLYSNLKILVNNSEKCNYTQFNEPIPFFSKVNFLIFGESCIYSLNTCPLMFKNLNLQNLIFNGLSFTFLKTNLLSFKTLNDNQKSVINSSVIEIQIDVFKVDINNNLFNENLITKLEFIFIYGVVRSIDKFTFYNLKFVKKIIISLYDESLLYSNNEFDWLFSLDQNLQKNITIDIVTLNSYTFPDSDFCLYKNFINLNQIDVFFKPTLNCSCLIVYLFGINKSKISCPDTIKYFENCNFTKFSKINCDKTLIFQDHVVFYDKFKLISQYMDFLSVILLPFACVLSILTNLLNIFILIGSKKYENKIRDKLCLLYEFILFNSLINLIYSFNYLFHLFNNCIMPGALYCSNYANNLFIQYYEIFIIDYFGNILKSLSNFLDIVISMTRYSMLEKNGFFQKIIKLSNLKRRVILGILIIFLCVLNIDKIGNSQVFLEYLDILFGDVALPIRNTFKLNKANNVLDAHWYYYINQDESYSSFYVILYILNIIINDVFLYVGILMSDLFLMFKFKSNLELAILMKKKLFQSDIKKLSDIHESKVRTVFAIWSNLFVLLLMRSFEMIPLVFTIYGEFSNRVCMYGGKSCTAFIQFANASSFYFLE
ncbi:unnamed protein product [Brachionus calyciflorus]|uniref:G-protein coupled receptors family 1 profile domain-containing protein n=1 Tax=Brachionus calyciflorus TaxID=104777 RepID=A0A814C6C1_9BILA|nr:unnamed protein product [Brachionus calyciflorus]